MNNIDNIIENRDDVAVAVFAAQLGAELKYVDQATTNKPSQQPQANRLNPRSFLRESVQLNNPQEPIQYNNSDPNNIIVPTTPLKDLIIPLPDQAQMPLQQSKIGEQLELPLKINERGKPTTVIQWFSYIDQKIDDLDLKLTLETQKINKAIRDLIIEMNNGKRRKIKVNQNA